MQSCITEVGTPDVFSLKHYSESIVVTLFPKLKISIQRLIPRGLIVFRIPLTPDADVKVVIFNCSIEDDRPVKISFI